MAKSNGLSRLESMVASVAKEEPVSAPVPKEKPPVREKVEAPKTVTPKPVTPKPVTPKPVPPKQKVRKPEPVEYDTFEEEEALESTELFDIEAEGVRYPALYKKGKNGKTRSSYFLDEEYAILERNAAKHRMSTSTFLRTLVINSK